MSSIRSLQKKKFVLKDGETVHQAGCMLLMNDVLIDAPGPILSFIELENQIVILLHWYHASNLFDISRNIFCYSKATGEPLWQVEQPWEWRRVDPEGKKMRKVYVEEVYKLMWLSMYENGERLSADEMKKRGWNYVGLGSEGERISAFYYLEPFRPGIDRVEARTWSHFPKDYAIDIDTGKVELLEVHQPSEKIY